MKDASTVQGTIKNCYMNAIMAACWWYVCVIPMTEKKPGMCCMKDS